MTRLLLSPEEYEFFSVPPHNGVGHGEVIPLHRVAPDLNDFFLHLPVRFCAVLCTTPEHASRVLTTLQTQSLAADTSLHTVPHGVLPSEFPNLEGLDEVIAACTKMRMIEAVSADDLSCDWITRRVAALAAERGSEQRTILLIWGTPPSLLVGMLLASFPATVIDGVVFYDQESGIDAVHETGPSRIEHVAYEYHRLQQKSRLLEQLVDELQQPVVVGYGDGSITGANAAFMRLSGMHAHELLVLTLGDLVSEDYRAAVENVLDALVATGRNQELQVEMRTAAHEGRPCRMQLVAHVQNGRALFFSALLTPEFDMPSRQPVSQSLRQQFLGRLDFALQRASRQKEYAFAVLVMGIDGRDQLFARLSADDIEEFSRLLSKRVSGCLRNLDVPAHLDPDHFSILLDDVTDVIGAIRVAQRIQDETRKSFRLGRGEVQITCSFGVVLAPFTYEHPEDILRDAQTALSRAQQRGERQTVVFDDRQNNRAMQFLRIESELRNALANQDVRMYYQPVMDLASSRMCGIEAFMRWERKRQGLVRAEYFLPFAEHSDLMFELESWTIRQTCRTLGHMQHECGHTVFLGLNVSLKNLLRLGFLDELLAAVRDNELNPASILLEIREAWLPQLAERFPALLRQVQESGMGVVLDHFTANSTSILDLHQLPLRGIKLAPSLLEDVDLVSSLVNVAQSAHLHIHVPGLERPDQVRKFTAIGCSFAQGDIIAPAMTEEEIEVYAKNHCCRM